ncbi:ribosomal-protein-alanine N-acetyltransferase [Christiangramia gaetbulicola]|uniref:Ribosomal-protein-alanine N-acetyltransferase n=1 Tax=Christiangramia gaetbulicola TaxID=703340 RepID=A0A2T6AG80_9FLAO|nr:GNAT family N-acetyltransferase [Christiangramia gaetbulicola]PTX42821.1 ribosomal-protein-alanine N-acetyltransferase [Christiangramia gaetbulicola]
MKERKFPHFETDRLILNEIQTGDQENIFRGLSHPEVIRYYGVQYSSFEETQEQMDWYTNLKNSNSGLWWAIRLKESNEFCGAIGINDYHPEYHKAEIGFWLLPEYWGKGIIAEAANTIIPFLFDHKGLHRIEAYVEAGNHNSARLLKKLCFELEGRMVDCEVKDGKYISVDIFAKIDNPNWHLPE